MAYPGSNEIATLAEIKALDNISVVTYDTFLSANIPTICRAIENYCRRRFLKQTWGQWCTMEYELLTDNWPINNVLLLGVPYDAILITDTNNIYNFNVSQVTSNNIQVEAKFTATNTSTLVSTDFLFSTHLTLGTLKTAVEGALAGVTFAYQSSIPSTITAANINTLTLRPTSGKTLYAGLNYFDLTTSNSVGDVYRINENSDRLLINPNYASVTHNLSSNQYSNYNGYSSIDSGSVIDWYNETDLLIVYDSGYTTALVPQELKWVVASIIRDLMSLYNLDGSGIYKGIYASEGLGDYNYKLADNAQISQLLNRYHDLLDFYKKKVI